MYMRDNAKDINRRAYNSNASVWNSSYSLNNYTHSHIEKPAIIGLLGDIKGKRLLSIGCGSGEESKIFADHGAKVIGFDLSEKLIKIARSQYQDIEFHVGDAETFIYEDKFDIAYAGFVAHYLPTWSKFLSNTAKLLDPDGELIFSIVHPIKRVQEKVMIDGRRFSIVGYSRNQQDKSDFDVYGDYLNSHEDRIIFGEGFETIQYHRPIGQQIREILRSPFELIDVVEPQPVESAKDQYPNKYSIDFKIPRVLIYHLRRRG